MNTATSGVHHCQIRVRDRIFVHNQVDVEIAILLAQTFAFEVLMKMLYFIYNYIKISKQFLC